MAKKSTSTNSVVNLATKGRTKKEKVEPVKEKTEEVVDPTQKAKETVENLLADVPMDIKSGDDLLELDETPEDQKSEKWLQEQVAKLADVNQKLREEAATARENYLKIHGQFQALKGGASGEALVNAELIPDSLLKNNVMALFEEVQSNMLGLNQNKTRYKNMSTQHLLRKMLDLFPFVNEIRKF